MFARKRLNKVVISKIEKKKTNKIHEEVGDNSNQEGPVVVRNLDWKKLYYGLSTCNNLEMNNKKKVFFLLLISLVIRQIQIKSYLNLLFKKHKCTITF